MKYKVGDKVRVKGGYQDAFNFTEAMQGMVGEIYPIESSSGDWYELCDADGTSWVFLEEWLEPAFTTIEADIVEYPHYFKDVSKLDKIDIYRVLKLYEVTDPCLQHIVKKALVTGGRTAGKDFRQDLQEIFDTAKRALEMLDE